MATEHSTQVGYWSSPPIPRHQISIDRIFVGLPRSRATRAPYGCRDLLSIRCTTRPPRPCAPVRPGDVSSASVYFFAPGHRQRAGSRSCSAGSCWPGWPARSSASCGSAAMAGMGFSHRALSRPAALYRPPVPGDSPATAGRYRCNTPGKLPRSAA